MRLKLHQTTYLSRRITRDLITCDFIEARKDKASIEEQVERILDEVIIINDGEIVLSGNCDELRQQEGGSIDDLFRRMFKC